MRFHLSACHVINRSLVCMFYVLCGSVVFVCLLCYCICFVGFVVCFRVFFDNNEIDR